MSPRVETVLAFLQDANFNPKASDIIIQEMWEKWVALTAIAAITCLMRDSIDDVLTAPGGPEMILALQEECRGVASASGFTPRPPFMAFAVNLLTTEKSPLVASMIRDVEAGTDTEADHILGDFIARAERVGVATPLLRIAYCHLCTYSARRTREAGLSPP